MNPHTLDWITLAAVIFGTIAQVVIGRRQPKTPPPDGANIRAAVARARERLANEAAPPPAMVATAIDAGPAPKKRRGRPPTRAIAQPSSPTPNEREPPLPGM